MQSHAYAAAGHRQLGHACLEEGAAEVAAHQVVGLLKESVGLVAVAQVGRGANHVRHLLCQYAEHRCRGTARGSTGLLLYLCPVNLRCLAAEPLLQLLGLVGVGLCPCCLLSVALGTYLLQLLGTTGVEFLHFGEYLERICGVGPQVFHRLNKVVATQRSSVCGAVALVAAAVGFTCSLAHDAVTYDKARALFLGLCLAYGLAYLLHVVAVNLLHEPSPRLVLLGCVLAGDNVGAR